MALTLGSGRWEWKRALPRAMKVRGLWKPAFLQSLTRSDMGSLLVPPTLMARRRAMQVVGILYP